MVRRQRVPPDRLARLWGRALRASLPSTARMQFRRHVEHFLRSYGRRVWGKRFDPAPSLARFSRAAGLPAA